MPYINVDHSKFEAVAAEIDRYVTTMRAGMTVAQAEMTAMALGWDGIDYDNAKTRFRTLDDKDSAHDKMIKALESYARYLRYAAKQYKNAQSNAINRANSLPKW